MDQRFGTEGPLRELADWVSEAHRLGGDVDEVTFRLSMRWLFGEFELCREALHRLRTAVATMMAQPEPDGGHRERLMHRVDRAMLAQADARMAEALREGGDVG